MPFRLDGRCEAGRHVEHQVLAKPLWNNRQADGVFLTGVRGGENAIIYHVGYSGRGRDRRRQLLFASNRPLNNGR